MKVTIILRQEQATDGRCQSAISNHNNIPQAENNSLAKVVEEREKIKPKLDKALLFVGWKGPKYLCCIVHVVSVAYSIKKRKVTSCATDT
jgi:hypothetical protein